MSSHDPFGHLKHKLWPKERSRVKLAIWLPTTKRQKSTQFPCVQVVCNMPLKIYQRGLQLCFRPHPDRRFAHKVIAPQSRGNSNLGNFGTFILGVPRQKAIWMWASWRGVEYTIWGKVVASFKSGLWWVLWVRNRPWLVLASKVLQQCTNQLVGWFCAGSCEWIVFLSFFLVPSWSSNTPLYP
jgi:hypothetical protein